MKRADFQNLVRNQVTIVSTPGPLASAVIAGICAAAEDFARDCAQEDTPLLVDVGDGRHARAALNEIRQELAGIHAHMQSASVSTGNRR